MKTFLVIAVFLIIFGLVESDNQPDESANKMKNPENGKLYPDSEVSAALAALAGGLGFIPTPLFNETNTVRNPISQDVTFWCRNK